MPLHHLPLSSLHSNALSFCWARCCHEQSSLKFSHSSSQHDCLWHCKRIHIHYIIRRNHSSPLREVKEEPKPSSELQRIGIGQALAILAMIIAGIVEQQRLKHAGNFGNIEMEFFEYFLADSTIHTSRSVWSTCLHGTNGVFCFTNTRRIEKFEDESLSMSSSAIGSYVATIMLTAVPKITSN